MTAGQVASDSPDSRKADLLGNYAKKRGASNGWSILPKRSKDFALQRRVTNFKTKKKKTKRTPRDELKSKIDYSKFTQNQTTVDQRIDTRTQISGTLDTWDEVSATVRGSTTETHPARSGTVQNHMGHIGKDEYFIRTGDPHAYEGGHVIPLSAWRDTDTDVAKANDYENLVPQSRTVNVGSWAATEFLMKNPANSGTNWKVDITRDDYDVPYSAIAQNLLLTLANPGADKDTTITMNRVTPTSMVATPQSGTALPGLAFEPGTVEIPSKMITAGADLVNLLKRKKLWNFLDDNMQTQVNAIP